jgi:hypothetical protein
MLIAQYLKACGVEQPPPKITMHRCSQNVYAYQYDTVVDGWHYIVSPVPNLDSGRKLFWELIYEASPPKVLTHWTGFDARKWTEEDANGHPSNPRKIGRYYHSHRDLLLRKSDAVLEIAGLAMRRRNGEEF